MRPPAFLLCFAMLAGCATKPAEPVIRTVEVRLPVSTPCPDKRPPFTDPLPPAALAQADGIFALAKLYAAAVILYRERLREDDRQVAICASASPAAHALHDPMPLMQGSPPLESTTPTPPGVSPAPGGSAPAGR